MTQKNRSHQSVSLLATNVGTMEEQGDGSQDTPGFPVIRTTVFHPMATAPTRGIGLLPSGIARLVSVVGLGTALLLPLSGCSDQRDANLPCPVPIASTAVTPVVNKTPTATCTTSDGKHYLWIHNRGGWVQSDDGVHPNANAHGIGVDNKHGTGGVGNGHAAGENGG